MDYCPRSVLRYTRDTIGIQVMEYCPGGDCGAMLQSCGFFEEPIARFFCAEALLGLDYLHTNGVS